MIVTSRKEARDGILTCHMVSGERQIGKTHGLADAAHDFPAKHIIVLTPAPAIADQFIRIYSKLYPDGIKIAKKRRLEYDNGKIIEAYAAGNVRKGFLRGQTAVVLVDCWDMFDIEARYIIDEEVAANGLVPLIAGVW